MNETYRRPEFACQYTLKSRQLYRAFKVFRVEITSKLLGCGLFLRSPTPFYGFGNALPAFRSKISLLLQGFLRGGGCRYSFFLAFLECYGCTAAKQGASLLQLSDLTIDLNQNL